MGGLEEELITGMLSAGIAQLGVQQNADMRRISAWAALIAVPTMVTPCPAPSPCSA